MNILYSKEERPRAGVVIHDCILALGRLVKSRKKKTNKEFKAILGYSTSSKAAWATRDSVSKVIPLLWTWSYCTDSLSLCSWIFLDTRASISEQEEGLCKDKGTLLIPM